jgi:hypothetical protein
MYVPGARSSTASSSYVMFAVVHAAFGSLFAGLVRWRTWTDEPATFTAVSVKRPRLLAVSGIWMDGLNEPTARLRIDSRPVASSTYARARSLNSNVRSLYSNSAAAPFSQAATSAAVAVAVRAPAGTVTVKSPGTSTSSPRWPNFTTKLPPSTITRSEPPALRSQGPAVAAATFARAA